MPQYEFDDDEPYVVIEKQEGSVGSFLLGIALGAGIALLFAPQSGLETRQGLTRGARRVRQRAQDVVEDATERVSDTFQHARSEVETRIDTARQAIDLKRQQVARAVEAGRVAAQEARDELERRIAETKEAYQAGGGVARAGGSASAAVAAGRGRGTRGSTPPADDEPTEA
jgi:gas vesicle protein